MIFIIIDGRKRNLCMFIAINHLTENGCIILDNSERTEYTKGVNFLLSKGFKKLDFNGLYPGLLHYHKASVFYRNNNCFNL